MFISRDNPITFPTGPLPESYVKADRSSILWGVGIAFIVLELAAFGLRVVARRAKGGGFGWDDALMSSGLFFNLALCALCLGESFSHFSLRYVALRKDSNDFGKLKQQ